MTNNNLLIKTTLKRLKFGMKLRKLSEKNFLGPK